MPDIPICLCAATKIGPEDHLVIQPDSDIGGRRAKLKAYELSPKEWDAVLYLDADTEVVAPIYYFWQLIEDGFEFVITKDPHLMDTMHAFKRSNNKLELAGLENEVKTLHTLQWNGGVWAFGRNARIRRFFVRWQIEWEKFAQRDQGALVRAMYTDPLKIWLLGNEWNTFDKYTKGITTAGLRHYPGDARRWSGMIPGRIDSPAAWTAVRQHEENR
jgi:lipopolysaccharide biosynthesis glycosyltransferase